MLPKLRFFLSKQCKLFSKFWAAFRRNIITRSLFYLLVIGIIVYIFGSALGNYHIFSNVSQNYPKQQDNIITNEIKQSEEWNSSSSLFSESTTDYLPNKSLHFTIKLPSTSVYKNDAQFQVVGDKIYFLWAEKDTNTWNDPDSIVISSTYLNGSGYKEIVKTDKNSVKLNPQFQVVGSKIYAIWINYDTLNLTMTAFNTDGTGFEGEQIITVASGKPQFQVVGNKIFYALEEVLIGNSNLDGSDYRVIYDRNTDYWTGYIQFKVVDSKIYAIWIETDNNFTYQLVISSMNIDGSDSTIFKTNSLTSLGKPQFQVVEDKIYYSFLNHSVPNVNKEQVSIATSNLDLSDLKQIFQTNSNLDKCYEQLQVVGSKIYLTWYEEGNKIVMASLNIVGSDFNEDYEQVNVPSTSQLQITESKAYYLWEENSKIIDVWLGFVELGIPNTNSTLTNENN